jgi:hypothetical protein
MAADSNGYMYFLAANGTADTTLNAQGFPINGDYGNAFMKLCTNSTLAPCTSSAPLGAADYFNEYNTVSESNADEDLGSGGALVLPPLTDGNGTVWNLAVGAGKDRNIYIVNTANMGKYNASTNDIYQEIPTPLAGGEFGMAAYFNGSIYYGSVGDNLRMFNFVDAKLQTTPSSMTSMTFPSPGATPSISANGTANAIAWATENTNPAVLYAFDATNLATMLYNSNQAANSRDQFGAGNKFITPMIANGKVYVGTTTGVGVFGLLPPAPVTLSPTSLTFSSQTEGTTSSPKSVTLTNQTSSTLTSISPSTTGNFAVSTGTNACGSTLGAGANCLIYVTFSPLSTGTLTGTLSVSDSASNSPQTAGLTGTGAGTTPTVSLSTTSLTFAAQVVNTTSAARSVGLTNSGTGTLTISKIAATGNFAVSTGTSACGSTLAGGAECYIYVTFTPSASGTRTGTLSITDNASGSPQSVSLSGTGMDFSVSASPSSRSIAATASTTFTLTVAPQSGFTGTVAVSCTGAPSTMTCTLSPTSVTLSGASQTSTATVKTTKTRNGTYRLTLTGTDGALSNSTTVTVKVP